MPATTASPSMSPEPAVDPSLFATHRFALGDTMAAYDTFADAANTRALKVVLQSANGDRQIAGAERSVAVA